VLDVGTHDARGRFRSQRPAFAFVLSATGLHPEELLLDDVGDLADPTFEQVLLLEQGCFDGLVTISPGKVSGRRFKTQERMPLGGQQITGAPGGLELPHGAGF